MSVNKGSACGSLDKAQAWFLIDYEVQTGIIAEPETAPLGNGHIVLVLYTMYAPDRVFMWKYAAGAWYGTEDL